MPNTKTPTQKMGVFQCPLNTGFAGIYLFIQTPDRQYAI